MKFTYKLAAVVLVLSLAVGALGAPPTGYTLGTRNAGTSAFSSEQAHSGSTSVKMTSPGTNDGGYITFTFAPGFKFADLNTFNYWEYVAASSFPLDVFVDIWLDFNGNGIADGPGDYPGYLQAEPYYVRTPPGGPPLNTWTNIDAMSLRWSTYVGPDAPYEAPYLSDLQGLTPYVPGPHNYTIADWNNGVDFSTLDIVRIDVRVGYGGTWSGFVGYADDITINNYVQQFDLTPPTVTCSVGRSVLWPPFRGMIPVSPSATVTDDLDPSPTLTMSVYSNEAVGAFAPDALWDGTNLTLRAERDWPGSGRIYLIVFTGTDASGNSANACCSVIVPASLTVGNLMYLRAQAAAADCSQLPPPGFPYQILAPVSFP